jgi:trehalose/maltose hydrolase-like predicted phosphorylase
VQEHAAESSAADGWEVRAATHASSAHQEALFTLGNGFIGVRGSLEETWNVHHEDARSDAIYLNGVFESVRIAYHEKLPGFAEHSDVRPPAPNPLPLDVMLDGASVFASPQSWLQHERVLDLRNGVLSRTLRHGGPQGPVLELRIERIVSFARVGLVAQRITITGRSGTRLSLHSRLDAHTRIARALPTEGSDPRLPPSSARPSWQMVRSVELADSSGFVQHLPRSRFSLVTMIRHVVGPQYACFMNRAVSGEQITEQIAVDLDASHALSIVKLTAYAAGRGIEQDELLRRATDALSSSASCGFAELVHEQEALLQSFWREATVWVRASPEMQLALRHGQLQLLQAAGQDGRTSIAAKGQSGEGYEGHYFWDAEVFCLPLFVYTAPSVARRLLEYRYSRLAEAQAHARRFAHARGALFPWRTIDGNECSSYFPAGSAQYHINAAIAYAVKQYVEVTGDSHFLDCFGAELVFETARIWIEVGLFDPRRANRFCIPCVTGPDEYTAMVDNNFYTNAMARAHLEFAVAIAQELGSTRPDVWRLLQARLELGDGEIEEWRAAAAAMYLPYDDAQRLPAQDDRFLHKPTWPFAHGEGAHGPLLLKYHPLVLYRHQVCKQADAVLAMVLLREHFDDATRRHAYHYYESITMHDSALSPGIFSIAASHVGESDDAWRYFMRAALLDMHDLHGNTAHGLHMASMGASWMCLVLGFGGMQSSGSALSFNPTIPQACAGYAFRLRFRGNLLHVDVSETSVIYRLLEGKGIGLRHRNRCLELTPTHPECEVWLQEPHCVAAVSA